MQATKKRNIYLLVLILVANSCIDSFMPADLDYEKSIYIEAIITDNSTLRSAVTMLESVPIEENLNQFGQKVKSYIDSAEVFVLCDDGSEYLLEYSDSGSYLFPDAEFTGTPGKSYKLIIHYDGDIFESDFEFLEESPAIDSLTYKVKEEKISEDGLIASGYEFLVSTHEEGTKDCYFRWIPDVTYSYSVPYQSDYIWSGRYLRAFDNSDVIDCWYTRDIPDIFVSNTIDLGENTIIDYPLHFESQHGPALFESYRVNLIQLRISKNNYDFWKDLDKLINGTGGLYETQPFRLSGNIYCSTDSERRVIGNFEVAGLSMTHRYFERPVEFPIINNYCSLEQVGTETFPWFEVDGGAIIVYNKTTNTYYTSDINCFDCTIRGGVNEIPAFWEYK